MKPRVRTVLLLMVLLTAGAIVNVAVAWGTAWKLSWPDPRFTDWRISMENWPRPVPSHWPNLAKRMQASGLLWTLERTVSDENHGPEGRRVLVTFLIEIHSFGFPSRALTADLWQESVIGKSISFRTDGHPIRSAWRNGLHVSSSEFALPLRPIWPGFAINTVFYAVILWGLFAAPFALRRLRGGRRIKRGLCPKCAYPVGTNAVCTECGAAVARKVETSAPQSPNVQRPN